LSAFLTGVKELDDALSYLRDKSAKRIGKAASRRMAAVLAQFMRPFVPPTLAKSILMAKDRGIGSRGDKAKLSNIQQAKAGVAVGKVGRNQSRIVNRGGRKGVGVSARNLMWFGAGTKDRYSKQGRAITGRLTKSGGRHFTGRIDKGKWGGFVQRGVAAGRSTAIAEGAKTINRMIAAEWKAAKGEGSPIQVQFDD
jgi:hypothetical protein